MDRRVGRAAIGRDNAFGTRLRACSKHANGAHVIEIGLTAKT